MAAAINDPSLDPAVQEDARACFAVAGRLWASFNAGAKLRLTVSEIGDLSTQHQQHAEEFFNILADEVNSKLCPDMKAGLSYMSQPCHYIAHHCSQDMHSWAVLTGGIPYGRSSNQVNEHMNKVVKRHLTEHTNDHVDVDNINNSKFTQVLVRIAVKRLRAAEIEVAPLRKKRPCAHCAAAGVDMSDPHIWHARKSSRNCLLYVKPVSRKRGRELASVATN